MKTKVLITGGCGFIGVNLVNRFLKNNNFQLVILDNLSTGNMMYLNDTLEKNGKSINDIKFIKGDIRDKSNTDDACKGADVAVHLAAHAGVIPSIEDPFHDFSINASGTLNMLDSSVKAGVKRFIMASSNAPLGTHLPPMNENLSPRPLSPYGASKLACEGYCSAFYGSYGLNTTVLRFSNAYGSYSLHKNSVVSKFIKDAFLKKTLTIFGDGSQTRDLIHVSDICEAINKVIETKSKEINGEIFHLGTGMETEISKLADVVTALFGDDIKTDFLPARTGEIKKNYSDISKAGNTFDFSPAVSLNDGVTEVFEWFAKQGREKIANAKISSGSD